jgi:hypothetical protein
MIEAISSQLRELFTSKWDGNAGLLHLATVSDNDTLGSSKDLINENLRATLRLIQELELSAQLLSGLSTDDINALRRAIITLTKVAQHV